MDTIYRVVNRVNRSGNWNNDATNCTVSNRNNNNPDNRNNNIGFRLVSQLKCKDGCPQSNKIVSGTSTTCRNYFEEKKVSRGSLECPFLLLDLKFFNIKFMILEMLRLPILNRISAFTFSIAIIIFFSYSASAQNCSVNAGVSGTFCAGQPIELDGATSGTLAAGQSVTWSMVSGPGQVTIANKNKAKTTAIATQAGSYTFRLTTTCGQGGTVSQDVTHEVTPAAAPDAGPDQTVACFDGSGGITVTGYNTPPPGYIAYWTVSTGNGRVDGDVFYPDTSVIGYCGPTGGNFGLTYTMTNGKGCIYTDTKTITIEEFVPELKLAFGGGCGKPYTVSATCKGNGTGTWTWINPVGGGGAIFKDPSQTSTEVIGLLPNTTYTVQFSFTGSCNNQTKTLTFTTPISDKGVTNADCPNLHKTYKNITYTSEPGYTGVANLFFCGAPDTIFIEGSVANIADDEVTVWKLDKGACDFFSGAPEAFPTLTQISTNAIILTNLTNGTYELEYQITCSAGCLTKYKVKIEIEAPGQKFTYHMSNDCADPNYTRYNLGCRGSNEAVIWGDQFVHFVIPSDVIPVNGTTRYILKDGKYKPVSAPTGGENIEAVGDMCGNFSEHWFEYYLNIDKSSPSGTYIFNIPIIYGENESPCGESFATIVIDFSQPPKAANAGTDQYFCGTSGSLIGNDVPTPEWRLAFKRPAGAADPQMSGINSLTLDVSGMSPEAEYYFEYISHGGASCGDKVDTVKIGTSSAPPPQPNAGPDQTLCYGSSVLLAATPASTPLGSVGTWTVVSQSPAGRPPTFSDIHNPAATMYGLEANTVYVLRYTLWNKCGEKTDEVTITTNGTEGPAAADAGANQCLPIGTASADLRAIAASPAGATGTWSAAAGNPVGAIISTPGSATTTVTGLTTGTYRFVWTISKPPCADSRDTVLITVGSMAEVDNEEIILCNQVLPTTINLQATPATGGQWQVLSGNATPTNPSSATTQVNNVGAGLYIYRWLVQNGACSSYKDVTVKVGGVIPQASAGADATLCTSADGVYTLNANAVAGVTGFWTVEDMAPNTPSAGAAFINGSKITDANATIQLTPGSTRLRWTLLPGGLCNEQPTSDDIVINYVPKAAFLADTVKVCNSPLVSIAGVFPGNAGNGLWTKVSGPSAQFLPKAQNSENPLIIELTGGTGTYQFLYTIQSAICPMSSATLTVINSPLPAWPTLGPGDTLCVKDAIFLHGSDLPDGYTAKWTYKSGPTPMAQAKFTPDNTNQNVEFSPAQTGRYEFNYTITNGGCTVDAFVSDSIRVSTLNAGPDQSACGITTASLGTPPSGAVWVAEPGNPATATVNPGTGEVSGMTADGDYFFRLEENMGDRCYDVVKVTRKPSPTVQLTSLPENTLCQGGSLTLQGNGSGDGTLTYIWQVGNSPTGPFFNTGTNSTDLSPNTNTVGDKYYRIILQSGSGCKDTTTTTKVTVAAQPNLTTQPQNITACEGDALQLMGTGGGGVPPLTYQWQSGTSSTGPWADVSGAVNSSYQPIVSGGSSAWYRLIVSSAGVGCNDAQSTPAQVMVHKPPILSAADTASVCNAAGNGETTIIDFSDKITQGDPSSVSWMSIDIAEPPGPWTAKDFTAVAPGVYRFVATTTNAMAPCPEAKDTILITVKECCPIICTNEYNQPLCNLNNTPLDLSTLICPGTQQGSWFLTAGPGVTNPKPLNGTFNPFNQQAGAYTITYELTNTPAGCPMSSSEIIQVIQQPTAGAANTFTPVCTGRDTVITLGDMLSGEDTFGTWQSGDLPAGSIDNTQGTLSLTNVPGGTYHLKYTVPGAGSCPSDEVEVTIVLKPTPIAYAGDDQIIDCHSPQAMVGDSQNSVQNADINWTTITGQMLDDPKQAVQTIVTPGLYLVSLTNPDGCTDTDTVEVRVGAAFIQDVSGASMPNICHSDNKGSIHISHIDGGTPPFTYSLSGPISKENVSGLFDDLPPGSYQIKITDANGCITYRDYTVDNPPPIQLDIEGDTLIHCQDTIVLTVVTDLDPSEIEQVQWYAGQKLIEDASGLIENVTEHRSAYYLVRLKNRSGCEIETRINIKYDNEIPYFAPNVFSPNYDQVNDIFKIYFDEKVYKVKTFRVFDRWGALMCEQHDIDPRNANFGWDGSHRGKPMEPGVYVWMAEVDGCDGRQLLLKGDMTIVR